MNLKKLREIGNQATEGPWKSISDYYNDNIQTAKGEIVFTGTPVGYENSSLMCNENDSTFVVEARNNWNQMLDALEEAHYVIKKYERIFIEPHGFLAKEWLSQFEGEE